MDSRSWTGNGASDLAGGRAVECLHSKDSGKSATVYEVHTIQRAQAFSKRPATVLTIGDLNTLYDIPEVYRGGRQRRPVRGRT